jgi:hypothetical protein
MTVEHEPAGMGLDESHDRLSTALFEKKVAGFLGLGVAVLGSLFILPPIPQAESYHAFADDRALLGVPNFWNVVSNLPFLVVGVLALSWLVRHDQVGPNHPVLDRAERWPLVVFFCGVFLTAFGSIYYHLAPDNERLVWDRMPMTVAFMGFFSTMIAERISVRAGVLLLWPLVWLGFASVFNWQMGERRDAGDLRLYGFVQFYPLVSIPLMLLLFPARYTRTGDIVAAIAFYGLAKLLETHSLDHGLYDLGQVVSGHTLKHLAAAMGAYFIYHMLRNRRPIIPAIQP